METKQKLGIRVFYYYLYKRISIGLVLLIFSFMTSSLRDSIIVKADFIFSIETATIIVKYFIVGLFIVSILFIVIGIFISWIKYISYHFTLGENAISISRGFFTKKEVSIPYMKIQNINIEKTLNFKIMGISKLIILTAGSDDYDNDGRAEGVFDAIDSSVAEKIKEYVLERSHV